MDPSLAAASNAMQSRNRPAPAARIGRRRRGDISNLKSLLLKKLVTDLLITYTAKCAIQLLSGSKIFTLKETVYLRKMCILKLLLNMILA